MMRRRCNRMLLFYLAKNHFAGYGLVHTRNANRHLAPNISGAAFNNNHRAIV